MEVLFQETLSEEDITNVWKCIEEPPTLCNEYKKDDDKEVALAKHHSRFNTEP